MPAAVAMKEEWHFMTIRVKLQVVTKNKSITKDFFIPGTVTPVTIATGSTRKW